VLFTAQARMLFSDTSPSGQGSKEIGVIPVTISKNCVVSRNTKPLFIDKCLLFNAIDIHKIAFELGT